MATIAFRTLWQLARRIEDVFNDVAATQDGLAKLRSDLSTLEKRVTALELREELLVEKTRSAASAAASAAATNYLVDLARRVGMLEAGFGGLKQIS